MGLPKLKHVRVGPMVDVAACGERGSFAVAMSRRYITCPKCQAKYAQRLKTNRAAQEVAARRRFFDTMAASKAVR